MDNDDVDIPYVSFLTTTTACNDGGRSCCAGTIGTMQVVKFHKRRLLAVLMSFVATCVFVLLAVVATIQQQQTQDSQDKRVLWTSINDTSMSSMWARYGYETQLLSANETPAGPSPQGRAHGHDDDDTLTYVDTDDSVLGEYDDGNDDGGDGYDNDVSNDAEEEPEEGAEDDEDDENDVFRDGDFDSVNSTKSATTTTTHRPEVVTDNGSIRADRKLHSQSAAAVAAVDLRVRRSAAPPTVLKHKSKSPVDQLVEDLVFWSRQLDALVPHGLSDDQVRRFQQRTRRLKVVSLTPPSWDRCGRENNQFVTFEDGSHACARHRAPHDYLVQGEVLSFYLARLLAIHNVPAVVLSRVNSDSKQWSSLSSGKADRANKSNGLVTAAAILAKANWDPNSTVALIQWIDGLHRIKMPGIVFDALKTGRPISRKTKWLVHASADQLTELLQWSDLVVFDYITGNYDRVASMQDAAEKEGRPDIFQRDTIHNLAVSRSSGQMGGIWLIDNESGLLDTYSLMYDDDSTSSNKEDHQGSRFIAFHDRMLRTFCVFRRSTHDRIASLLDRSLSKTPLDVLVASARSNEPLFTQISGVMAANSERFAQRFQQRIRDVYVWMNGCRT